MLVRGRTLIVLVALLGAAAAAPARAETAEEAMERGERLFESHRFRMAVDAYERAYERGGSYFALFHIAECYRELGEYQRAIGHYRLFRAKATDKSIRAEADRLIKKLEGIRAREGAEPASVDKKRETPPPPLPRVREPSRERAPRIEESGGRGADQDDSGIKARPSLDVPNEAVPVGPPAAATSPAPVESAVATGPTDGNGGLRPWHWALIGAGGAAVVAAVIAGALIGTAPETPTFTSGTIGTIIRR